MGIMERGAYLKNRTSREQGLSFYGRKHHPLSYRNTSGSLDEFMRNAVGTLVSVPTAFSSSPKVLLMINGNSDKNFFEYNMDNKRKLL